MAGKRLQKKKTLGYTNMLGIYLVLLLGAGLLGGYSLAIKSIQANYVGALACYTAVFAPIGTAIGIVLGKIVDKNKAENTGGNGDGIVFAAAQAVNFTKSDVGTNDSPAI